MDNQKEQLAGVISFPFHIAGWLKNTMHLDTLEKGAYFMLLIAHYQSGSIGLPDDDKKLSRICGLGMKTWLRIKPTMQEFFTVENDFWQSKKTINVLREIHVKSSKQRDKALKRFNSSNATALPQDCQPKTKNQKPKNSIDITPISPTENENKFDEFWREYIPYDMVKGSKQSAEKNYNKALKEASHETIISKCREYCQYCQAKNCRTKHAATWLNQRGWEDDYSFSNSNQSNTVVSIGNKDDKLRDRVNATGRLIEDLLGETRY